MSYPVIGDIKEMRSVVKRGVTLSNYPVVEMEGLDDTTSSVNNRHLSGKRLGSRVIGLLGNDAAEYVASGSNPEDAWVKIVGIKGNSPEYLSGSSNSVESLLVGFGGAAYDGATDNIVESDGTVVLKDLSGHDVGSIGMSGSTGYNTNGGMGNIENPDDSSLTVNNNKGLSSYLYGDRSNVYIDLSNLLLKPFRRYLVKLAAARVAEDPRASNYKIGEASFLLAASDPTPNVISYEATGSELLSLGIGIEPVDRYGYISSLSIELIN